MSDNHEEKDALEVADSIVESRRMGSRYSLKEMMEEVIIERKESVFGRELVDATEIEKMFSKNKRKKKKS